ncbi:LysE family transporter [Chryseobacterium sp. MYb264]|uniref:LysE family translocator n=1 Tax=Chryseobacterium sp. MYb264 TaxID=2745153 RepID=UPI002E0D2AD8|nr:LysE family transporter [Chryseobacterium sp. MYb264]
MFELILSAVGLGFMLSLVFIGPIFFLLIETSFSRGPKHALSLDLGVITADIICIIGSYYAIKRYSSKELSEVMDSHPVFYWVTSVLIFVYGIYMILSKTKMHVQNENNLISQNYLKTFFNGFLFNFLNIGVLLFWLVTVITVRKEYPNNHHFVLYLAIIILTYFTIDLVKIFLAKQFHYKLTQNVANNIRKIVGCVLILFSIFIFLQSFPRFNQFDKRLEEAEKTEIKYQKNK